MDSLVIILTHSDRERRKDTFLTAEILFSLDRCLLMGDPREKYDPRQK
jgi:hypothetical protein